MLSRKSPSAKTRTVNTKGSKGVKAVNAPLGRAAVVAAPVVVIDWVAVHAELTRKYENLKDQLENQADGKARAAEIDTFKLYLDWKAERLALLPTLANEIDSLIDSSFDERQKNNKKAFVEDDIKDYLKAIQEFWRDVQTAVDIRSRLRRGTVLYLANPTAKIDELYAGSVEQANHVTANDTVYAKLINNGDWFTYQAGVKFVKHQHSRSAALGYSPAGLQIVPLHIGHRNDKSKQ